MKKDNGSFRDDVWSSYEGRCFYCSSPMLKDGKTFDDRDWLLSPNSSFVKEHETPKRRGGLEDQSNFVPACQKCNSEKGTLTRQEFRMRRALSLGDMNYSFPYEMGCKNRDWLCCHSKTHERGLLVHNLPSAQEAYDIRRILGVVT